MLSFNPKVKDIILIMEEIAPPQLALEGDRIGLQVGEENTPVEAVLICLDVTEEVIEEAKKRKANLIISHHPIIYEPLKQFSFRRPPGSIIKEAAKYDISIYTAHTNLDIAPGGVNDALLKILSNDLKIKEGKPLLEKEKVRFGLGKLVLLEKEKNLEEIVLLIKNKLSKNIRVIGENSIKIKKVALCGGSGKELVYIAYKKGAQLFITGELSYHFSLEAKSLGLSVIEAGHYETEVVVLPFLEKRLRREFKKRGWDKKVIRSRICTNPYSPESII